MIDSIELMPTTAESYPFSSAEKYLGLSGLGYMEQEYSMKGTANVYRTVDRSGAVEVKNADVAYANRFIIRAPKDPSKASGNVVVEILNSTAGWEIERMWILTHKEIVRSGDIYVGITSKHNTKRTLVAFDEDRYGFLSWPNPTADTPLGFTNDDYAAAGGLPDLDEACEPGLFWDMLTDLAWKLRSDDEDNPIKDYQRDAIALMGWSQSGSYTFRYLNTFAYREDVARGGRVFDGYLTGGGVHGLVIPANQYESMDAAPHNLMHVEHVEEPFIEVQTETENGWNEGWRVALPDSDRPDFKYRHYDIAGASHDTVYSLVDYYCEDEDLKRIGELPTFQGSEAEGNDYPSQILMAAALRNLFTWIRTGVGPRTSERIPFNTKGENLRDAFGNALKGLRTCLNDYPTGVCEKPSVIRMEQDGKTVEMVNPLFSAQVAFSSALVTELYGSLEHYRELCVNHTAEQVSKGFVCKEDAGELVDVACKLASQRGLK